MKKNRKYLKPYIRKARSKDFNPNRTNDFHTLLSMAFYKDMPKVYVLVQHGSNMVIAFGNSKDELKQRAPIIRGKGINRRFNTWKNKMKHYCQDN